MAPSAMITETLSSFTTDPHISIKGQDANKLHYVPLKLSGALEEYKTHDLAPLLCTRFKDINLSKILKSPDCDEKIRDLAITSK